jgi:hypothetical protein
MAVTVASDSNESMKSANIRSLDHNVTRNSGKN